MGDVTRIERLRRDLERESAEALMKIAAPGWLKFGSTEKRAVAITVLGEKGRGNVRVSRFLYELLCSDPSPDIQSAVANAMGQSGFVPLLGPSERDRLCHIAMSRLSASDDASFTCSLLRLLGECEGVSGPQMAVVEGVIRTKQEQMGGEWKLAPVVVWTSYALIKRGYKAPECLDMLRSVLHIASQPILTFPVVGTATAQAADVSMRLMAARLTLLQAVTALGSKAGPLEADLLELARNPEFAEEPWRSQLDRALGAIGAMRE